MKKLIDYKKFESLSDVEIDVDWIYDKYFRKPYNQVKRGVMDESIFKSDSFSSDLLISKRCKEAHKLNPITIFINNKKFNTNNFYKPSEKLIGLRYPKSAFNFIKQSGGLDSAVKEVELDQVASLKNEFTEHAMKGSIHHELAHWIDDSLHGNHINKKLKDWEENPLKLRGGINTHYLELEGQIHNIKQLYDKYRNEWDDLTFLDMVKLSPSINHIYRSLKKLNWNQSAFKDWRKRIKKRMFREGLLGKNMY